MRWAPVYSASELDEVFADDDSAGEVTSGRSLDFHDPWGNSVQVVQYDEVQFTKADHVLSGMGLALGKTERALGELRDKGLADPG